MGEARHWHICFHISVPFFLKKTLIYIVTTQACVKHTTNSNSHNDVHTNVFAHTFTRNLCTHYVFPGLTLSPPLPSFPLLVPTERCHHPLSPKACLHPGHFFRWPGKSRPAGGVRSQSQPFTAAPATAC